MEDNREDLIARAIKAKKRIKEAGHIHIVPIYAFLYPEDNNEKGRNRVQNVIQGRLPNLKIIQRLEDIADQADSVIYKVQ